MLVKNREMIRQQNGGWMERRSHFRLMMTTNAYKFIKEEMMRHLYEENHKTLLKRVREDE